ncbi:MAG: prolyl oligopeptidase family serine peptidase [Acidimicrobiales bacterium]
MSSYPPARRSDDADVLHGRTIPDPYRWLEDADAPETIAWSGAQDDLVRAWFAAPDRAARRGYFTGQLHDLLPGYIGPPIMRGDRMFVMRRDPDQDHAVLLVREGAVERVLIDPNAMSDDHTTTLDQWVASWEGERLAYMVSEKGTEQAVLHVMDVASAQDIDEPILCGRHPDLAWLPGGDGFFYVRRLPEDELPAGEEQLHRRVWWRAIGTPVGEDVRIFGDGLDKTAYYGLGVSVDGRWLDVSVALGTAPRNDLFLLDLDALEGPVPVGDLPWKVVQRGVDALTSFHVGHDGVGYVVTNLDAPRFRIAVCNPEEPTSDRWRTLVPESDAVLDGFALTDDAIVVAKTRNVVSELDVRERTSGDLRAALVLPGLGSASVISRPTGGREIWVVYTDFVTPPRILRAELTRDEALLEPWAAPKAATTFGGVVTRQEWVASDDGTLVPVFIVGREGPAVARPTILYGYGGFRVPLGPGYSSTVAAWVEAGGVWAQASLRGGGEFGEEWHRAGMRGAKQHVFDDFAAIARWLVAEGWTDAESLGIYGGSNGGLLVGAALTQHPELCRAVVCSAPLLDMVRYERFGLGVTWNDEYGTADDPEELGWLLGYSPYHHVTAGVAYPSTLFTVFDADSRVDPLHARKMCAALQAATSLSMEDAPVMIRREADVGHGARSVTRTIELGADVLAFFGDRLGLGPQPR